MSAHGGGLGCSSCQHHHQDHKDHQDVPSSGLASWRRIIAALILSLIAEAAHWFSEFNALAALGFSAALLAIALTGTSVYRQGIQDLRRLHLGIHALMALAVTGALLIGQWPEAAMVMALYAAAQRLEEQALERANRAIGQLLAIAPETAEVLQLDGSWLAIPIGQVSLNARVRVLPGGRIPLDGRITEGCSAVNQAPITGESALVDKEVGDIVWAGSINHSGLLVLEPQGEANSSLLARIARAVEQAQKRKAPVVRFVDHFASVYTPIVIVAAVLLAVLAPTLWGWSWQSALYQALALLVIACPCALVLSTPVTLVSALSAAARKGVLLKGASVFQALRRLGHVAFDKTGTLTLAQPSLQAMQTGVSAEVLAQAQALAASSEHPLARALARDLARDLKSDGMKNFSVFDARALAGRGMQASLSSNGERRFLVSLRWVREQNLSTPEIEDEVQKQTDLGRSVSLFCSPTRVLAWFALADTLRGHVPQALQRLSELGVRTSILSGDDPLVVQALASALPVTEAHGGLLPEDKLAQLERLQREQAQRRKTVAMVGDGINDAPALAQADIGVAMGGAHSTEVAIETADVVLMHDDLRRLADMVELSRRVHWGLWQNISVAVGVKLGFFVLAFTGNASMWMAVLADVGISLLVVANGLRLRGAA